MVKKQWLVEGRSKSCGCIRKNKRTTNVAHSNIELQVGQQYNSWQIIAFTAKGAPICRCLMCNDTIKTLKKNVLIHGRSRSCGCQKNAQKNLLQAGDSFGNWRVVENTSQRNILCKCICGNQREVSYVDLLHGKSRSCGCSSQLLATETNFERYGHSHPHQSALIKDKKQQSMLLKYGVHHSFELIDPTKPSKAELEILEWVQQFYPQASKFKRGGRELDILVPELNLGIEYNGLFWHNEHKVSKNYHLEKTKHFAALGIRVIHIFEHEWLRRQSQVKSFLRSALQKNEYKIGARECDFVFSNDKIEIQKAQDLLELTHIQGKATNPLYVVNIYHKNELIGVATFGKHHRNSKDWILSRFATRANYTIQGALAKISRLACEKLQEKIISWADYRLSTGNGYLKAGWKLKELLPPDYFYHKQLQVFSKQSRQKKKVKTPSSMTEHQHALLDGLSRIYDCGKIRFEFTPIRN
jgi:hypothetical protein